MQRASGFSVCISGGNADVLGWKVGRCFWGGGSDLGFLGC